MQVQLNVAIVYSTWLILSAQAQEESAPVESTQPSHILMVLSDDLGSGDIGVRSSYYRTPTIDFMARDGTIFANAYSSGATGPTSRSSILTGQYPARETNNVFGNQGERRTTPLKGVKGRTSVPPEAVTLAETMKTKGYVTCFVGTFHVASKSSDVTSVHGFDIFIGTGDNFERGQYSSWGGGLAAFTGNYTAKYINDNILPFSRGGYPAMLLGEPKHLTDATTDAALQVLQDNTRKGRAVFMIVGYDAPHGRSREQDARQDLLHFYRDGGSADSRSIRVLQRSQEPRVPAYGALVEGMDQGIGRLLRYLQSNIDPRTGQPLSESSVVAVTSDNGGVAGVSNLAPYKGEKGLYHEGGLRVPLIFWSGDASVVARGKVVEAPTIGLDLYRTIVDLAGAGLPEQYPLDGMSLAPLLSSTPGPVAPFLDRALYWHVPAYGLAASGDEQKPVTISFSRGLKLTYSYENSAFTMFDVWQDPSEDNNLLKEDEPLPARARRLAQGMRNWMRDVVAPLPVVRASGTTVTVPEIDAEGFVQSREAATLNQSIPEGVGAAATIVATVGASVGASGGGTVVAVARSSLAKLGMECLARQIHPIEFSKHPLGFSIGTGEHRQYVGNLVGNLVLIAAVTVVFLLFAFIRNYSNSSRKIFLISLQEARFQIVPVVALQLSIGLLFASATLIYYTVSSTIKALAACALLIYLILMAYVIMLVIILPNEKQLNGQHAPLRKWFPISRDNIVFDRVNWKAGEFFFGTYDWKPASEDCIIEAAFIAVNTLVFRSYVPKWRYFFLVELFHLGIVTFISAWSPLRISSCFWRGFLLFVSALILLCIVLRCRPYRRAYENVAMPLLLAAEVLTALFTWITHIKSYKAGELYTGWSVNVASGFADVLLMGLMVKTVVDVAVWVCMAIPKLKSLFLEPAVDADSEIDVLSDVESLHGPQSIDNCLSASSIRVREENPNYPY